MMPSEERRRGRPVCGGACVLALRASACRMAAPPERRWPSAEEAVAHPAAMRWHSPEFEGIQQLSMAPDEVGPLRQRMLERNGLHPELHDPSSPGFAQRAAAAFHRDGFCPPPS